MYSFYEHGDSGINVDSNETEEKAELSNSMGSRNSKNVKGKIPYQYFEQPTKDPGFGS